MTEKFSGKVVFVTGGTGALGSVVVKAFHAEGARIAATYRDKRGAMHLREKLKDNAHRLLLIKADVTKELQVQSAFRKAVEAYGTVDFLFNIAGGFMEKTPISDLKAEDWDRMMDLNLRSAFLCSRSALRIMIKKKYGRIISISAMPGLNPSAGRGAYAISKSGVSVLTQIMADEVKGTGITANVIVPSIVATEANIRSSRGQDRSKWVAPSEIAELIMFLCSDDARSINGAVIKVYGGI